MKNSYAAGLFDGEGCVSIRKYQAHKRNKNFKYYYSLFIRVGITNKNVLKQISKKFGGRVFFLGHLDSGKPSYAWYSTGKDSYSFIKTIQPYVIIKHLHLEAAIEFYEKCRYKRFRREKEKYYQQMRRLNK